MENNIKIIGKTKFQNIETGYWSIVDKDNTIWRITNFPNELKKNNINVKIELRKIEQEISIFMQGITAEILNFDIINPK